MFLRIRKRPFQAFDAPGSEVFLSRGTATVVPTRARRIVLLCEKMASGQALDRGLADELADDGGAVDAALLLAEAAAAMPAATVRMVKQAVNATATALHNATAFADADQSQLTGGFRDAIAARRAFAERS